MCCVLFGVYTYTEAALLSMFTPISRRPAKFAMTPPWIHSGARSELLCMQAVLMAHFAGRREIDVKFPMRAASVEPEKQTTHAPDNIELLAPQPSSFSFATKNVFQKLTEPKPTLLD